MMRASARSAGTRSGGDRLIARSLLIWLLPQPLKRVALRRLFGWTIHPSARVGLSLFDNVRGVRLGAGAHIGHFNVFRDLERVELGEKAFIGQWNWITAADVLVRQPHEDARGFLSLGEHAAITSRHYVDCTGGVDVGAYATVAGVRSTILTHQIDVASSSQQTAGTRIGAYCFVGSDVRIVPGVSIADRCLVAMGAVVAGDLAEPGVLYGGVPAKALKHVDEGEYFRRTTGYVD
jgi:acetyltransferase-like isoleucine patch superfamily enzyme